jgi:hypothetical protein
MAVWSA